MYLAGDTETSYSQQEYFRNQELKEGPPNSVHRAMEALDAIL